MRQACIALLLATILIGIGQRLTAQDSLYSIALASNTPDTLKARIYGDLSFSKRFKDPEQARSFALLSLQYAKQSKHEQYIAQAFNDLGIVWFDASSFDSALHCYFESEKIRKKLNDEKGLAAVYNKIGIVYQSQGKTEKALIYQLKSLKVYEHISFDFGIGTALNNIAVLYYNLNRPEDALAYYKKSIEYKAKIGDIDGIGGSLSNIGNIYYEQKEYRKAIDYYHTALNSFISEKHPYYISSTFNNLGRVYRHLSLFDSAFYFINKGLEIREKTSDVKGLISSLSALGSIYAEDKKEPQKALQLLSKALTMAEESKSFKDKKDILFQLSRVYKSINQPNQALIYYEAGHLLGDSLLNEELTKSIAKLRVEYETEKKEKENLALIQQNQEQVLQMAEKQETIRLMIGILVITLMLGLIMFLIYKNHQAHKVREMLRQLEQQQFREILLAEEKERERMARELHDGVGQMIVSAKLQLSAIELEPNSPDVPFLKTSKDLLDETLEEVRGVSHDLMPRQLEKLGLKGAIQESLERINKSSSIAAESEISWNHQTDPLLERSIYRIYQEVIGNMLKYSEATLIQVYLNSQHNEVNLMLKDNGKGFDASNLDHSAGIGWQNIKFRVNLMNGDWNVRSELGKGTEVFVKIPILALNNTELFQTEIG